MKICFVFQFRDLIDRYSSVSWNKVGIKLFGRKVGRNLFFFVSSCHRLRRIFHSIKKFFTNRLKTYRSDDNVRMYVFAWYACSKSRNDPIRKSILKNKMKIKSCQKQKQKKVKILHKAALRHTNLTLIGLDLFVRSPRPYWSSTIYN